MNDFFVRLYVYSLEHDRGQTMAEYVIVLGIISVGSWLALTALRGSITRAIWATSPRGLLRATVALSRS